MRHELHELTRMTAPGSKGSTDITQAAGDSFSLFHSPGLRAILTFMILTGDRGSGNVGFNSREHSQ